MRRLGFRLWVPLLAAAFAVLWLVSLGVYHGLPPAQPEVLPAPARPEPALQALGVVGWVLVSLGGLGVLAQVLRVAWRKARVQTPIRRKKPAVLAPQVFSRTVAYTGGRYSRPVVQRRYYR